jgi:hypothetical protein
LAQQSGLIINDDTITKIIGDDIFSWSELLEKALLYMECQLRMPGLPTLTKLKEKPYFLKAI